MIIITRQSFLVDNSDFIRCTLHWYLTQLKDLSVRLVCILLPEIEGFLYRDLNPRNINCSIKNNQKQSECKNIHANIMTVQMRTYK